MTPSYVLEVSATSGHGSIRLTAPTGDEVRTLLAGVRDVLDAYRVEPPEIPHLGQRPGMPFKVFIAYGGGRAWEVVRDYLKRAEIPVDAFTEEERASEVTLDVVSEMVHSATMAVVVMTGADEMKNGALQARQNVVHEAGFAQGALGVRNVIVLVEDGVQLPSNIAGLTFIPFARGEIHTTEERVVRLIRARMLS